MKTEIVELIYKTHNKLQLLEAQPKDYGTGEPLFASETHTICAISNNPGINLTELSKILDISKSGTSKFIKKLLAKEYILKLKSENNKKEVKFYPTEKGSTVSKAHSIFKKETFEPLFRKEKELDPLTHKKILDFLRELYTLI